MLSPSNNLFGNPAALKKAFETGGKSVVRGMRNMLDDVRNNGGWPAQVDKTGFEVGVNMAATPGEVVYRSNLIELIQYRRRPKTSTRCRCCSARRGSTSTTSWISRPGRA